MPPGTIMGHEFAGEVAQVGAGVDGFAPGDAVVAMSYVACGECDACRAGMSVRCSRMRLVGFGDVPGAYAELMKTRASSVFKMPPGTSSGRRDSGTDGRRSSWFASLADARR